MITRSTTARPPISATPTASSGVGVAEWRSALVLCRRPAEGSRPTIESFESFDSFDSDDESVDGAGLRLTRCSVLGNVGEGARSPQRPDCGKHPKHGVHVTNGTKPVCR